MTNYYAKELLRVIKTHDPKFNVSIKVFGTNEHSKQLDITPESIESIVTALRIIADRSES